MQAVALNQKLLVCAPSNVAVDNLLERIVNVSSGASSLSGQDSKKRKILPKVIRFGHPARITDKILPYCLDAIISNDEVEYIKINLKL